VKNLGMKIVTRFLLKTNWKYMTMSTSAIDDDLRRDPQTRGGQVKALGKTRNGLTQSIMERNLSPDH